MKIERNPYFRPEESVLYCGDAVYSRLQSRGEPETPKGYVRIWKIQVQRAWADRVRYIRLVRGVAKLTGKQNLATVFHSYKEASDLAVQVLNKGNALHVGVVEILSYDYVEEDYAP
jgi:hypothetical protein